MATVNVSESIKASEAKSLNFVYSYPSTLPQTGFMPLTDERQANTIRTQMDSGLSKTRKRYTGVVRRITMAMVLDGDERKIFDTFYGTTINEGADRFMWTDPVNDASVHMRFTEPVTWSLLVGSGDTDKKVWQGTYKLEILP